MPSRSIAEDDTPDAAMAPLVPGMSRPSSFFFDFDLKPWFLILYVFDFGFINFLLSVGQYCLAR